jgi:hypothetical protein
VGRGRVRRTDRKERWIVGVPFSFLNHWFTHRHAGSKEKGISSVGRVMACSSARTRSKLGISRWRRSTLTRRCSGLDIHWVCAIHPSEPRFRLVPRVYSHFGLSTERKINAYSSNSVRSGSTVARAPLVKPPYECGIIVILVYYSLDTEVYVRLIFNHIYASGRSQGIYRLPAIPRWGNAKKKRSIVIYLCGDSEGHELGIGSVLLKSPSADSSCSTCVARIS